MIWQEPKQYSASIWIKLPGRCIYTRIVHRLYDEDMERLLQRAQEWIDEENKI